MVNHYASLLLNLPGELAGGERSYFTSRNYSPVILPPQLQSFYAKLFPEGTSYYHKQFLCYAYLRLIASTNITSGVLGYDSRVTYDLDKLQEYFRLRRVSSPTSTSFDYSLIVFGEYTQLRQNSYYYNLYSIRQVDNLPEVLIYSEIDKVYLRGKEEQTSPAATMRIPIDTEGENANLTSEIPVGETGLYFRITGPLESFTATRDKVWTFMAESPFSFDFPNFIKNLKHMEPMVDRMIAYGRQKEDSADLNIWNRHFNDVYRFTGLLNLYIDKVNDLWQAKVT